MENRNENLTMGEMLMLIANVVGTAIMTIVMQTELKMNKTRKLADGEKEINPYHNRVEKRATVNLILNTKYENAMKKALVKAGKMGEDDTYENKPCWIDKGERMNGKSAVIIYNEKTYIQYRPLKNIKTEYYLDGMLVTDPEIVNDFYSFMGERKPAVVEARVVTATNVQEIHYQEKILSLV